MRKQIAAANWKMNLTLHQGEKLLKDITGAGLQLKPNHQAIFAVPFPYLIMAKNAVSKTANMEIAAQNCYSKKSGAYTGEVSAEMLQSINIEYCVVGHSERREYFNETNSILAEKVNLCLQNNITPIFCCGEPLEVREAGNQNQYVKVQLEESLYHLDKEQIQKIVIAYEPIWAIGTGKTATTAQAQEIHQYIRTVLADKYGRDCANEISILYGGSVKATNAKEIFEAEDVDGGLVGGASLVADDFIQIIQALKS